MFLINFRAPQISLNTQAQLGRGASSTNVVTGSFPSSDCTVVSTMISREWEKKTKKKTGYCTLPIILIIMDDSPRALFLEQRSRRKLGGDGGVSVAVVVGGGRGKFYRLEVITWLPDVSDPGILFRKLGGRFQRDVENQSRRDDPGTVKARKFTW